MQTGNQNHKEGKELDAFGFLQMQEILNHLNVLIHEKSKRTSLVRDSVDQFDNKMFPSLMRHI